ncbi:MAG TPA: hypothetical protein EYP71_05670 [Dehalococcoidia bacterium]|nr:hypothetical protein [Dehalococcoidia bacterium]
MSPLKPRINLIISHSPLSPFVDTWKHHHTLDLHYFTCEETGALFEIIDAMAEELNSVAIRMELPYLVSGGKIG